MCFEVFYEFLACGDYGSVWVVDVCPCPFWVFFYGLFVSGSPLDGPDVGCLVWYGVGVVLFGCSEVG